MDFLDSVDFLNVFSVYKSLQDRLESRENAWTNPGWDKCVAHTGNPFSSIHTDRLNVTIELLFDFANVNGMCA